VIAPDAATGERRKHHGSADFPVGTANEQANDQAVNGTPVVS